MSGQRRADFTAVSGAGSAPASAPGSAPGFAPGSAAGSAPGSAASGWQACRLELTIAGLLVLATGAAAFLYAGLSAAVLTVTGWSLVSLAVLRALLPPAAQPLVQQEEWRGHGRASFIGFWRKRAVIIDATARMTSYDHELRQTLQHLLAARLSERHGVSLYQDPAAARGLLLPGPRDDQLWYWLDPQRPAETDQHRRGIPARTLAAIIDRLERL